MKKVTRYLCSCHGVLFDTKEQCIEHEKTNGVTLDLTKGFDEKEYTYPHQAIKKVALVIVTVQDKNYYFTKVNPEIGD